MTQIENRITTDEGKVFRRISDGLIYGKDITLGYTYYIGGKLLTVPRLEVASDFEEIDEPSEDYITEGEIKIPTTLDEAKADIKSAIHKYDMSSNVNEFYYDGKPCWIDKATRVGLVNSTNMEKVMGRAETTLILGEMMVELPCDTVLQMLAALEVYAKDCYNVTATHIINVGRLDSIEEVKQYDYKVGYPNKLSF